MNSVKFPREATRENLNLGLKIKCEEIYDLCVQSAYFVVGMLKKEAVDVRHVKNGTEYTNVLAHHIALSYSGEESVGECDFLLDCLTYNVKC
jgi:hypothetical protein